jgi:AraC-like DNA-binding protein
MAQRTFFTTDGIAAAEAYDAWRCREWPSVAPVFETQPREGAFFAESETFGFRDLAITRSRMAGLDYVRTGSRIRGDGLDHLGILILFRGKGAGDAEGRSLACGGGVVLGDLSRCSHWTSTASCSMTVAIPRAVAEEVLSPVRDLHGLVLGAARAQPLMDHVRALAPHLLTLPAASGPALARAFLHMLAVALGHPAEPELQSDTRSILQLATRQRAEALVEQHLHHPSFGVQDVARLLGLSRSALYRLFEASGGVAAFIRGRRLQRICAALADPADHRRAAEKAYACGLADQAQFIRAFRRGYGMTPVEYRAAMLSAEMPHVRARDRIRRG